MKGIVISRVYSDHFREINDSLVNSRAAVSASDPNAIEAALLRLNRARHQRENLDNQIDNIVSDSDGRQFMILSYITMYYKWGYVFYVWWYLFLV